MAKVDFLVLFEGSVNIRQPSETDLGGLRFGLALIETDRCLVAIFHHFVSSF